MAVMGAMTTPTDALPEPFAHICILPTHDAGKAKFFTSPSDARGFPVFTADQLRAALAAQAEAHKAELQRMQDNFDAACLALQDELRIAHDAIESAHGIKGE
jgi:hypothetical protein